MKEIHPINNNGSIQLKFSLYGKRYSFNPIPSGAYGTSRDMATARSICTRIQNDILAGHFDPTLNVYRLVPKSEPQKNSFKTWLELWDFWVDTLDLAEDTKADHYYWTRVMLTKANPRLPSTSWIPTDLATSTIRSRLTLLRACSRWAVNQGHLEANPWVGFKVKTVKPSTIKPFTRAEIAKIAKAFDLVFPHYAPFVRFLLITGCRISEVIGLRWLDVDFDRRLITIQDNLPIDRAGNGYRRIRKPTKTGSIRRLPMNDSLLETLQSVRPEKFDGSDLVFKSVRGKTISSNDFRYRHWKPVLAKVQVPYRKIHTTRHSFASHAIDQGKPLTEIAYLLGHSDTRMVMQTYGHLIGNPSLPDIF